VVTAAGHLEHAALRDLIERCFADLPRGDAGVAAAPPAVTPGFVVRRKDIEQSHLCIGMTAYPQAHAERHAMYLLNTILGGSMSSRLFQHIREDRGLAYAVYSSLTNYSDAGVITIYAGCATEKVGEVVDLSLVELRDLCTAAVPDAELRRAKDHLKGSLMLSLESTSSRMSQLARQEIYFGRHFTMDEVLQSIESVTADDLLRVARDLFRDGAQVATIVGPEANVPLTVDRLKL